MDDQRTVAACAYCGRGYLRISHDGVACLQTNCGGRLYRLPAPECCVGDDQPSSRERRIRQLREAAHQQAKKVNDA